MNSTPDKKTLRSGFALLAVFLPLGLVLESLHAMKVPVYFGSALRRELWTLAHAHGNLLGLFTLLWAVLAERVSPDALARRKTTTLILLGAWAMPVGFFLGGVLNREGDPSLGILLVPVGGCALLIALVRAALAVRD